MTKYSTKQHGEEEKKGGREEGKKERNGGRGEGRVKMEGRGEERWQERHEEGRLSFNSDFRRYSE